MRAKNKVVSAALIVPALLLSGCATATRDGDEAPKSYLSPSGWQDVDATLAHASFAEHMAAVTSEVKQHRMPLAPDQAELEISMVSPNEIQPSAACGSEKRGIAILVHGLSDTAFALSDIATVMADNCYVVRSILLPGHGTRAGDLLSTRYADWNNTMQYLIDQAAQEQDHVVVGGFSLGAVLSLTAAMKKDSPVDALLAFSPAYNLSSWRLARWAPLAHPFKPWIDRGNADDSMRYEAMPTRGVAETVRAIRAMRKATKRAGSLSVPWLLVQSADDAVIVPSANQTFFHQLAQHDSSRIINFYSDEKPASTGPNETWLKGSSDAMRVSALSHQAIHVSPDNPHYGMNGAFRNCGKTGPRDVTAVALCESANTVWYGLWGDDENAERPSAISTFNPNFSQLTNEIEGFLDSINPLGKVAYSTK